MLENDFVPTETNSSGFGAAPKFCILHKKSIRATIMVTKGNNVAQTNIIELNGKRYDAATGQLLGNGVMAGLQHAGLRRTHRGRSMDIMPKQRTAAQTQIAEHAMHHKETPKPSTRTKAGITTSKKPSTPRQTKVITAHQPQKSTILMRHAVPKPTFKMKQSIKTQAPTEMAAAPIATIVPKASVYRLEPKRAARAQSVARSQHIKRFASPSQPARGPAIAVQASPQRPLTASVRSDILRPAHQHHSSARAQPAKPQHTSDIFEAAIAHAASHLEPAPKVRRHGHRWVHVAVVAVTFLSIGATVTWANKANIEVHFASMRAGFHVVVPTYAPDGYTLSGNVSTDNGKATLDYHSGDANYTLTEQASSWDSATLQSSTVALQTSPQVMQTAGRSVYLYGNGNAMWVDGGVLYNLIADGSLNNGEIANLAATL